MQEKELVQLRKKPLKNGGFSLYLDYYSNGARHYKFLKLYLLPGTDRATRDQNKHTMAAALSIRAKMVSDIIDGKVGVISNKSCNFSDYVRQNTRKERKSLYRIELCFLRSWEDYAGTGVMIRDINSKMLIGYLESLRKRGLADSTISQYYSKCKYFLHRAVVDELIQSDPSAKVPTSYRPSPHYKERAFLTMDEVSGLISTDCSNESVKQAFLFSCFTGLRFSDISSLQWCDIQDGCIVKKQVKTSDVVRIPISENARKYLPPQLSEGAVFSELSHNKTTIQRHLNRWVKNAKVGKHITFHSARHTFATLLLTYGADLYTVSKLLGHSNISTTQIYAKIVDSKKKEAVNLIPSI